MGVFRQTAVVGNVTKARYVKVITLKWQQYEQDY